MTKDISDRYAQAGALMQGIGTNRIALNDAVFPTWLGTSNLWYRRETREGKEFRLVDVQAASNTAAFDHKALAEALAKSTGAAVDHQDLPIKNVALKLSPLQVTFTASGKGWLFEPAGKRLTNVELPGDAGLVSPDNKKAAFVRDHNLWVRDLATGKEKALTNDGSPEYTYSNVPDTLINDPSAIQAAWSPDSKQLLTFQLDFRKVGTRPIINYVPQGPDLRPTVRHLKAAYPGDKHVEQLRLLILDASSGQQQKFDYHPIAAMPFGLQGFELFGLNPMAWWSPDGRRVYFVEVTRGCKAVRVVELDTNTGTTRVLIEETSNTFVKLCNTGLDIPLFKPLPDSDELIWYSERSDYGHLYLYDLKTGSLKNSITEGPWLVRDVLHYDPKRRELLLQTAGRDKDISPYYRDICKVNVDSGALTPLVSGPFEHLVHRPSNFTVYVLRAFGLAHADVDGVSPDGQYVVTTRSRVDTAPVSVLVDRDGKEILELETADVSSLPEGWQWPEPVKLTGADGETDIHGVVFRPPGFSPDQRYPVVDFSPSMRDYACTPQGSFINEPMFGTGYLLCAAMSALGFVVVSMEGRGTPNRRKSFQEHEYGDYAATSDLTDRIAGLQQLAKKYPYMDLERVGVTAVDNYTNSVEALLFHPDFYKVATVFCPMDPRFAFAAAGETFYGVPIDGSGIPNNRYAEDHVESLQGKLLLVEGMLSPNTPSSTFRLVEALQKANKDFDMLCLPLLDHNMHSYAIRRGWDYLVRHLQGVEPPHEYPLTAGYDLLMADAAEPMVPARKFSEAG